MNPKSSKSKQNLPRKLSDWVKWQIINLAAEVAVAGVPFGDHDSHKHGCEQQRWQVTSLPPIAKEFPLPSSEVPWLLHGTGTWLQWLETHRSRTNRKANQRRAVGGAMPPSKHAAYKSEEPFCPALAIVIFWKDSIWVDGLIWLKY